MDRHGNRDFLDIGRHARQIDLDRLIVAIAFAGAVVASVFDRAVADFRLL